MGLCVVSGVRSSGVGLGVVVELCVVNGVMCGGVGLCEVVWSYDW